MEKKYTVPSMFKNKTFFELMLMSYNAMCIYIRAGPKVISPILLWWTMAAKVDVDCMAVEVKSSHQ